jgi:hypothetical protein
MRSTACAVIAILALLVWSPAIMAACGGGVGTGGGHGGGSSCGGSSGHRSCDDSAPAVRWCDKTVADLQKSCSDPFAIYFCTVDTAKYAGEGAKVIGECRKANAQCKATIWESQNVINDLKHAGVSKFVKIAATKENEELFKKFGAGANTLVVCAPNGDKLVTLADEQCSESNVCKELKSFKDKLDGWKHAQKKDSK